MCKQVDNMLYADTSLTTYALAILIGILSFICFNISYSLFSLHSCPMVIKITSCVVSVLLGLLFLGISTQTASSSAAIPLIILKVLTCIIIVTLCGWLTLIGFVYLFKYQVLYTDSHLRDEYYARIQMQEDKFENIKLITYDKVKLQGYLYKESEGYKTPLAIYFGGRGEEAANIVEYAAKISSGWSLAFINYRGCGLSNGRQSKELLFSDAALIYDYFARREDVDCNNIVLISHSLGTGVAIHLASQRNIKGIILSCPYDKYVTGVIQDKLPLIPIKLLITEEYNSISIVPKLKVPVMFLLAENDRTILRSRSMRLFHQWEGSPQISIIKGTHHENITINKLTWEHINQFISNI